MSFDSITVSVDEIPANSICFSCIWSDNFSYRYLTHFDALYLLERLVEVPGHFSVEKKNRLRRSFEAFDPVMITKANGYDSGIFLKTVMAFEHRRPRNIEMDFKVILWNCLEPMLKRIIGKYSFMSSEIYNKIPERERGLHADDTPVASSKLSGLCPGRPGTYLLWLEDTLFNVVKGLDADEDVRERLLGVLPDLFGAFALRISYDIPADAHRDAEYLVEKYRQDANNPQE